MPETKSELLLDPDCRDGKCGSCVGGPCEHWCHSHGAAAEATAASEVARLRVAVEREQQRTRDALAARDQQFERRCEALRDRDAALRLAKERGELAARRQSELLALRPEVERLRRKLAAKDAEIDGLNRDREAWRTRTNAAEAKLHEIAKVKVWTNEDGKRFVFADDLAEILLDMPTENTTPAQEKV